MFPEEFVESCFVVALAFCEAYDDKCAGHSEGPAGKGLRAGRIDDETPWRNDASCNFVTSFRVDDRDGGVENHAGTEHGATTDPCAFGDHRTAADERVVLDYDGCGLRRFENAAKADASREVHVPADLGA